MQPQLQPPYTGAMMGFGRFNLLKGSRWGGGEAINGGARQQ
jgi:hypothetical protein